MAAARTAITDEELLNLPKDGNKYEVVEGELRMTPVNFRHERVVVRVLVRLSNFVTDKRLGEVIASNAMYVFPGGNKRSPDVSFLAAGRVESVASAVFPAIAPDLAVEVLSPSESSRRMLDKVGEYLQAGVRLVWVIDPVARRAAAYRSLTDVRHVDGAGTLEGEDVVPGFRCTLAELLD